MNQGRSVCVTLLALLLSPEVFGCGDTAQCDFHNTTARYEGEDDYPGGVHYRVYSHSTGDRDSSGQFVKHKVRVKCADSSAAPACQRDAECPLHKVSGQYEGEDEYPGGVHYRVYAHTTGDRDDNGQLKKHKFLVRCD